MKIEKENLVLFKGVDLSVRRIPYLIAQADQTGPKVCLTAAIHGDEVTGTALINELFRRLEDTPLSQGTIYAFPILNPSGFESISRRDQYTEEDLNRNFPGDPEGTTAERHAWIIFSAIRDIHPDYIIDMHADSLNSIVYTLVDYLDEKKHARAFAKSALLAEQLGLPWAIDNEESVGFPPEECLTGSFEAAGIPAITLELGAPLMVMEGSKQRGLEALWNFLAWLGMIPGPKIILPEKTPPKVLAISRRIRTQSSGIIEFKVRPGEKIQVGKTLGKIRNVFGETIEIIRSPVDGILLSHEDQSVTFPGQALFTIAFETSAKQFGL